MGSILKELWNYEIQLAPIVVAFLLFDFVGMLRRWRYLPYSPIYFSVFPLSDLNEELAKYYGEDTVNSVSDVEAEKSRKKVVCSSIISFALAAVAAPLITGFVCAFFLSTSALTPFLVMLVIYKAYSIIQSLYNFHGHTIATPKNIGLTFLIYFLYLCTAVEMFRTAYNWAQPFIVSSNWGGMFSSLSAFVFGKIIVEIIISSLIVALLTGYITDRKLRDEINTYRETSE